MSNLQEMCGVFPQSEELSAIVERSGWTLYDTTSPPNEKAFTWEQLQAKCPAKEFVVRHNYMFVPIPKAGETLKQAYSLTKGFGPSLLVENKDDSRWLGLYLINGRYQRKRPILFTRLDFQPKFLGAFTPSTVFLPRSDKIAIAYPNVIDTFEKYFRIVAPEEEGLRTPLPMPPVPPIAN